MNKPAFPCVRLENHKGMTMRQWYKGMALANVPNDTCAKDIARHTAQIADALLKEDEEHEASQG